MAKQKHPFQRYMLRPLIYVTFSRTVIAATAGLVLDFVIPHALIPHFRAYVFLFIGLLFTALAWIAYLRMDGIRLPRLLMKRIGPRKKPQRSYGDMIDYVDEAPPVPFDDLEDDEKDVCCLWADLAGFVLFTGLSFFL